MRSLPRWIVGRFSATWLEALALARVYRRLQANLRLPEAAQSSVRLPERRGERVYGASLYMGWFILVMLVQRPVLLLFGSIFAVPALVINLSWLWDAVVLGL